MDTGDFSEGSESQHFVRSPGALKIDKYIEESDPSVPDSESSDQLDENEIDNINGMKQGIIATQIPDRRLVEWATHVLYLEGDEFKIINWFSKRRHCPVCQAFYHMDEKVPVVKHRCDRCGTDLIHKEEDDPQNIKEEFKCWRNSFWAFEEMAKHQKKFKMINIEKMKSFDDLTSRVNLWVRDHIELIPLNWWEAVNAVDEAELSQPRSII